MTLENKIEIYDRAKISGDTGEIESWDKVIFSNIIRKREMEIIFDVITSVKPRTILDLGCGAGWLSKILSAKGYHVIGIDISASLIKKATKVAPKSAGFLIGDCMNLPAIEVSERAIENIPLIGMMSSTIVMVVERR